MFYIGLILCVLAIAALPVWVIWPGVGFFMSVGLGLAACAAFSFAGDR